MAAPCPPWLKRAWIDWLGPERVWELYAGTEVQAVTILTGSEWLSHPGSVGRPLVGEMQVLDPAGAPLPPGEVGEIWMREDRGSAARTATSVPNRGRWATGGSRSATWARSTPRATSTSPTARATC